MRAVEYFCLKCARRVSVMLALSGDEEIRNCSCGSVMFNVGPSEDGCMTVWGEM